jgi:hypothetical protein
MMGEAGPIESRGPDCSDANPGDRGMLRLAAGEEVGL